MVYTRLVCAAGRCVDDVASRQWRLQSPSLGACNIQPCSTAARPSPDWLRSSWCEAGLSHVAPPPSLTPPTLCPPTQASRACCPTHRPGLRLAPGRTRLGGRRCTRPGPAACGLRTWWQLSSAAPPPRPPPRPTPPPSLRPVLRSRPWSCSSAAASWRKRRSTQSGGGTCCSHPPDGLRQGRAHCRLPGGAHRRHGGRHLRQRAAVPLVLPGHRCVFLSSW